MCKRFIHLGGAGSTRNERSSLTNWRELERELELEQELEQERELEREQEREQELEQEQELELELEQEREQEREQEQELEQELLISFFGEQKMNINELTIGQVQEIQGMLGGGLKSDPYCPWRIGRNYIIRTVTMILTGRLIAVTDKELVLDEASWIAETDRFADTISKGLLKEVEPYGDQPVIVGRGSIVDATEWFHPLPRTQK